jgi:inner membrane protein
MALPIAHAAAGYVVHRATRGGDPAGVPGGVGRSAADDWRRAALFMVLGNLPDFDFMVGFLLGRPGMFHRGVSHTVVAAVAFGIAAGLLQQWRGRERFRTAALAFGAAYFSHLVFDFLTIDHRPPFGGQFLWPFSAEYWTSPVTIFHEIIIDGRTRVDFLRTVIAWPIVGVLAREIVIAAMMVGAWHGWEAWRSRVTDRGLALGRSGEDLA